MLLFHLLDTVVYLVIFLRVVLLNYLSSYLLYLMTTNLSYCSFLLAQKGTKKGPANDYTLSSLVTRRRVP
jgi:hypothetical protein